MAGAPFRVPLGTLETVVSAPFAVTSVMVGFVTRALADECFPRFRSCLAETERAAWVIDATEIRGYEPAAVAAGARWFSEFKQRSGRELLFVSRLPAARMVAASLAFASGVPVRNFEELREAHAHLGIASGARPVARQGPHGSS